MKEELRTRGVAVLGALNGKSDWPEVSEARAWERDVIAAYPELEVLGPFSEAERLFAESQVLRRTGALRFEHGSTYFFLADGEIETLITTVAVRLYRLQHSELKPARPKKRGRKNYDEQDAPLLKSMHELFTSGLSISYAADAVAEKAVGKTFKSKSKRLERKFIRDYILGSLGSLI